MFKKFFFKLENVSLKKEIEMLKEQLRLKSKAMFTFSLRKYSNSDDFKTLWVGEASSAREARQMAQKELGILNTEDLPLFKLNV